MWKERAEAEKKISAHVWGRIRKEYDIEIYIYIYILSPGHTGLRQSIASITITKAFENFIGMKSTKKNSLNCLFGKRPVRKRLNSNQFRSILIRAREKWKPKRMKIEIYNMENGFTSSKSIYGHVSVRCTRFLANSFSSQIWFFHILLQYIQLT